MIKPADSDEERDIEDSDKAIAVKDDPEHTIAVTRGETSFEYLKMLEIQILLAYLMYTNNKSTLDIMKSRGPT